jgi:hypothetical protein
MMVMSVLPALAAFTIKKDPVAAIARPTRRFRVRWTFNKASIGRRSLAIVREHNS